MIGYLEPPIERCECEYGVLRTDGVLDGGPPRVDEGVLVFPSMGHRSHGISSRGSEPLHLHPGVLP